MYGLPQLVSIERIANLPIIKTGLDKASTFYVKVKKSNRIIHWSLQTAEDTVVVAIDISKPTIVLLDGPIHLVDEILCKSLDMVEDAVPLIKQRPDQIYNEAKNYVTSVMEPVLKRADSVKEISIQSAINYSTFAAESLDNVLTVADEYVDKYLPEIDSYDQTDKPTTSASPIPQTPTEKTIRHVNKFSRTLKRRLTMRTMYEARELKKQGVNLIHVLVHMTDLLARDPKAFYQKMKDLWSYLSEDEPENQEPPQNLEQLLVMITREGARRFVHVTNFSATTIAKIPSYATEYITFALHKYSEYVEGLHLNSNGVKRYYQILQHMLNDVFDNFYSLIKPYIAAAGEVKYSIQMVPSQSPNNSSNIKNTTVEHSNTENKKQSDQANGDVNSN